MGVNDGGESSREPDLVIVQHITVLCRQDVFSIPHNRSSIRMTSLLSHCRLVILLLVCVSLSRAGAQYLDPFGSG